MQVGRQDQHSQVHGKQSTGTTRRTQGCHAGERKLTNWYCYNPTLNKGRGLIYIGWLIGTWGQVSELMMDRCK